MRRSQSSLKATPLRQRPLPIRQKSHPAHRAARGSGDPGAALGSAPEASLPGARTPRLAPATDCDHGAAGEGSVGGSRGLGSPGRA